MCCRIICVLEPQWSTSSLLFLMQRPISQNGNRDNGDFISTRCPLSAPASIPHKVRREVTSQYRLPIEPLINIFTPTSRQYIPPPPIPSASCTMAPVPEWVHAVLHHRQVIASGTSFTEKAIALVVVGHILVLYTALCWLGASTISGEPRLKKRLSFTLNAIDSRRPRSSNGRVPRGPV